MATTPPGTPQSRSVWLERIPHPAIFRVVANLQHGCAFTQPTADTFALAFTSDSLRQLVRNVLEHKVDLFSIDNIGAVHDLHSSGIKAVTIHTPTQHHALMSFLRAPTLEAATLPSDEHLTAALVVNKSVRQLELDIHTMNNGSHIVTLLRALPLTKLSLSCYIQTPAKHCLFNSELSDPRHEDSISALCPDLEELHIKCTRDDRNAIFWRLFPNLSLKHATLHRNVRKDAWQQLRGMESVALIHVRDPVYHAERLGECVTSFRTMDILDDVDLRIMRGCPKLEVMHISVKVEHSVELLELMGLLPELKVLELTFNKHTMYSGKRGRVTYDRMGDGEVMEMVKAAKRVEELGLHGLQVPIEEMVETLRILGGRLRRFETCLKGQQEGIFERLERLLEGLCRYNYGIEEFDVWETCDISGIKSNLRRKGKDLAKRRRRQKEIGRRLQTLLDVLKQRTRWQNSRRREIGGLVHVLL